MRRVIPLAAMAFAGLMAPFAAPSLAGGLSPLQPGPTITFTGGFAPKSVLKARQSPASLHLSLRVASSEGPQPPPLEEFTLRLDRHSALHLMGFPACNPRIQYQAATPGELICSPATFGSGAVYFSITLPEAETIQTSGRLELANGGEREGVRTIYAIGHVSVPIPAEVLMVGKTRRIGGPRYGTELTFTVPKVAGGTGSITALSAKIKKEFLYRGHRQSVVTMACPTGTAYLGIGAKFADGATVDGEAIRPCIGRE